MNEEIDKMNIENQTLLGFPMVAAEKPLPKFDFRILSIGEAQEMMHAKTRYQLELADQVIRETFFGKPRLNIKIEDIKPGCLYVLDWGKGVRIHLVEKVEGDEVFIADFGQKSYMDFSTFEACCVGGPFKNPFATESET